MIETRIASAAEEVRILTLQEDHFNDLKSKRVAPSKLQETFVAFANSDGGEIYVGVEDPKEVGDRLSGFSTNEEANNIIHTLLESTNPAVENVDIEFINFGSKGLVLHFIIPKSQAVHYCANGECFIRINARKDKIKGDRITQLAYSKGFFKFEQQPLQDVPIEDFVNSAYLKDYMVRVNTNLEPSIFLRKQKLLALNKGSYYPNVGCALLFDEDPSATVGSNCSIKIYRLLTAEAEYKREQLKERPITVSGPIEVQIHESIKQVQRLLQDSTVEINGNPEKFNYPPVAIHEILVNAVIHRDYSLSDDIHIRIYDNRIEVISPGTLPGYITKANIYQERFSRNPNIVRMLHNLPNPVNHNIGEGLDTVRNEMRKYGLVEPEIEEQTNSVKVVLYHKKIDSLREVILGFFKSNPDSSLNNSQVRTISGENDVNKVKKALKRLRDEGEIELVDPHEVNYFKYKYRKVNR